MSIKLKMVIVDDDELICLLLFTYFESKGYSVATATNGMSALQCVQNNNPDIVILDVMMPCTNGLSVLRSMKNSENMCGIPVILLTANYRAKDVEEGIKCGAWRYITKPFDLDDLNKSVLSAIQNYRNA